MSQAGPGGVQEEGFLGTLFPVFVTVESSLDELNQIIRRSDEFISEAHMSETTDLYIISDAKMTHPSKRQAWPLPASFESPFIGKSVADLTTTYRDHLSRGSETGDRFSEFTFGVVDAQTLKDGTILCVSLLKSKPEELRVDAEIAAMIMMGPEVSGNGLTEGLKAEDDGVFYERLDEEKRKQYLEGSDDEEEDDDDDDE